MFADTKLPVNWKNDIDEIMGEGGTLVEVLRKWDISRKVHAHIMKDDQEYKEAIERGQLISEAWWCENGRKNVENKNYNNTLFIFTMKNRFGWTDRVAAGPNGEKPIPDATQEAEIVAKYEVRTTQ